MNKATINEQLTQAVNDVTPDILDDLMAELGLESEPEFSAIEQGIVVAPAKRRRLIRNVAGIAAAFALFIGGVAIFGGNGAPVATIGIDVNPSIELSVDKKGRVQEAYSLNEDGALVLRELDLKKQDVDLACREIADTLIEEGYLNTTSNSVLVSVRSKDLAEGKRLEEELGRSINEHLEESKISPSVLAQYVEVDEELDGFAEGNEISVGKANLIQSILKASGNKASEEGLLKLSTQELILLGQSKEIEGDFSYGSVDTSQYVSTEEAIAAALAKAGVAIEDADELEVEFECDDGIIVYEVEFKAGGQEYEIDVNATTGQVKSAEQDWDDDDFDDDRDDDDDDDFDDDRDDDDDDDFDDDRDDDDDDD